MSEALSDEEVLAIHEFSKESKQRRWSKKRDRLHRSAPGCIRACDQLTPEDEQHCHTHHHHTSHLHSADDATLQCVACTRLSLFVHDQQAAAPLAGDGPPAQPDPSEGPPSGFSMTEAAVSLPRRRQLSDCSRDVLSLVLDFCDAVDLIIVRFVGPEWWSAAGERLYFGVQEQSRTGPRLTGTAVQAKVQVATSGFRTQHEAHRFLDAQEKVGKRRARAPSGALRAGICEYSVRQGLHFFFPYFVFRRGMTTKHAVLTFGLRNRELFTVPWSAILGCL